MNKKVFLVLVMLIASVFSSFMNVNAIDIHEVSDGTIFGLISDGICRLNSWDYSMKVTVTSNSGSSLSNYQMQVKMYYGNGTNTRSDSNKLLEIYCNETCQTDFDDFRVTTSGGSLVAHYKENYSSADFAYFWVELNAIATGGTDFYIHWGNPTASDTSSKSAFLACGNFETGDLSYWTVNENSISGSYTLEASVTQVYSGTYSCYIDTFDLTGGNIEQLRGFVPSQTTCVMDYRVYVDDIDSAISRNDFFLHPSNKNYGWHTLYDSDWKDWGATTKITDATFDTWVHNYIYYNGSNDAMHICEGVSHVDAGSSYDADEVKFRWDDNAYKLYIDNIFVRKWVWQEPTWNDPYDQILINCTRDVFTITEKDNCTGNLPDSFSNPILMIPLSTNVQGIQNVTNNTGSNFLERVNTTGDLTDEKYYYDSVNQFIFIDLGTSISVNFTVNCSYGADFNLLIPPYAEVGDTIIIMGMIEDSDGNAIDGIVATASIKYANGSDALSVNPKWNCTGGNVLFSIPTAGLIPDIYTITIYFQDNSGIVFDKSETFYLSVDPGSGVHVWTSLHFTFYNSNTGVGLQSESFKVYASEDTTIDSDDRIYVDYYGVYTGQTVYYRIDDYFDNQIYPTVGTYVTLGITSINQFEDIPIDWYSFSVKNMNHSIVHFKMTNDSRTYSQYLYPYEPFYWDVLDGTYTINLTYYNPETDAIVDYHQENITITDDTYYWIRGYDLQDIIIEIQFTNTSVGNLNISIVTDITAINSTVNSITTDILSSLTLSESNLTTLINTYSSNYTIIESLVSYLNNTIWANFTTVNATINTINNKLTIDFDILNATIDYLNNTVWMNFDAVHSNMSNVTIDIRSSLTLTESNLTTLNNYIWNAINITDSVVDYLNLTVWNNFTQIHTNLTYVNGTITYVNDTVWNNFTIMGDNITHMNLSIHNVINLSEFNLTSLNLNVWNSLNLTDAIVGYLNNTMWTNFTMVNTTIDSINNKLTIDFDMLNVNITYLNNTIWTNLTAINSNIGSINNSIHSTISIAESNLTTLNNNIWNSINLTDSIITYFNNTIWSNLSLIKTTVDNIDNNIWLNLSVIESAVGNISTNVSIDYSIINTSIDNLNNSLSVRITLVESNLTSLNNNIWNSINITDSVIDHINNTLWNEISLVNVTLDYLNNTIWTNLSLIDSDINTLSVSVHTSLAASETNISNIVYNVWSSLNISNATIDYLNASIWNNLSFIQSSLNNTNLTITNMILLMENNITSLVITIENIIDFALMPDIVIWSRNPPMVFSVYDKEGMAIGGNIIKICPALITIATTRVETTGNWINSTAQIPYDGTVENGTITILEDALYISGSGSISYINITYADNGTLMQNTTYIPSKINLYGENLTINASGDIHILRETQYHQLYKFYWDYDAITGEHTAGIDIINPMAVPIYDVYVYVEFSNRSTADPTTVVMKDVANDGTVSEHGEDYDISFVGIHFYLLSINASSTRGFTIEYTKQFDDAYRYGEETVSIPTYDKTVWNGLSFNTFIVNWHNDEDTIFRGAVYAKLNFEIPTEINKDSVRIWDDDNNVELDSSSFIPSSGFIRIGADGIGDVSPGGGRSFQVYFLMTVYPGADPTELHLNTPIWMGITPFLIILLVGLILIGYSAYVYIYKEKKDWKNGIVLGAFIIFIFFVMAQMGI